MPSVAASGTVPGELPPITFDAFTGDIAIGRRARADHHGLLKMSQIKRVDVLMATFSWTGVSF
jgi:hypothetical protein